MTVTNLLNFSEIWDDGTSLKPERIVYEALGRFVAEKTDELGNVNFKGIETSMLGVKVKLHKKYNQIVEHKKLRSQETRTIVSTIIAIVASIALFAVGIVAGGAGLGSVAVLAMIGSVGIFSIAMSCGQFCYHTPSNLSVDSGV